MILRIGETNLFKSSLFSAILIGYAGMNNENTFSLIITSSSFQLTFSGNTYYPISQKSIQVGNLNLKIISVNQEYIELEKV